MALVGSELLIAVGVLLIVFLWGPQKLPELARSMGLAKKEFDKAAKEVTSTEPRLQRPLQLTRRLMPSSSLRTVWGS